MREKKIYEGKILGFSVYEGQIEGREVTREYIKHRGAAAMLAFDGNGDVILVRQHRFPHGHVLEIPAGTMEEGEEPKECAFRELEEETGYRAGGMRELLSFYPSIGYNSEIIHCFVASELEMTSGPKPDEDEVLSVVKMGFEELLSEIRSGRIQDSKTICAALTYASEKGRV